MPNGKGFLRQIEEKFGLPSLSKVAESFEKFPDSRQLKLIRDVLTVAERVAQTGPELEKVITLIREINSMPTEKLEKLEKVLKRIEGIFSKDSAKGEFRP
ncbi:unnamed protein product, partial [marine sediment metagenome]